MPETYGDVLAGSNNGPVIEPGNSAESYLVELITNGMQAHRITDVKPNGATASPPPGARIENTRVRATSCDLPRSRYTLPDAANKRASTAPRAEAYTGPSEDAR